jgi:hypothetical protein
MITTVTTTTVTSFAVAASLSALVIVALLAVLVGKEIIGSGSETTRRMGKALNVAVAPLAIVFVVTVLVRIVQALG